MSQGEDEGGKKTLWGVERPTLPRFEVKRRRRVQAEDLQERFAAWDAARRARRDDRTPEDSARTVRRWIGAGLGAGLVATVAVSSALFDGHRAEQAEKAGQIEALEDQVIAAEADAIPSEADIAGHLTSLSAAAGTDAEEVAAAQQAFAGLHRAATTADSPGDGSPSEEMLAVAEHRRALAEYFDEASYVATEDEAYQWTTMSSFDTVTEIDPRYSWYVRYDGDVAAEPETYEWSVQTVMPDFDDDAPVPDEAEVIWLCRDTDSDEVLAWATARYVLDEGSEDSGVFTDLEVAVTSTGAAQQRPQDRGETAVPELDEEGEDE